MSFYFFHYYHIISRLFSSFESINFERHATPSELDSERDKQNSSNSNKTHSLNSQFVTGFSDGEGCFSITITKNKEFKCGWRVHAVFAIGLHKKDKMILEMLQSYFSGGKIYKHSEDMLQLQIFSIKDLIKVLEHFDQFPLLTQKQFDYKQFKQAIYMIKNREHLTVDGLTKLVEIKAYMNKGLSDTLKSAFPLVATDLAYKDITPKLLIRNSIIESPNWITGFTSGEGCFSINISKSSANRLGFQVSLKFTLTQPFRDELLLKSFIDYLGCGRVEKQRDLRVDFVVTKFSDIEKKIIPFFNKYPIIGVKSKDFEDWCEVAQMIKEKKHLTLEGLERIREIKGRINKARNWESQDDDDDDDDNDDNGDQFGGTFLPTGKNSTKVKTLLNCNNSQVTNSWDFFIAQRHFNALGNKNSHNNSKFFNSFIHRYFNIQLIYSYFNKINLKISTPFLAKLAPAIVIREGGILSLSNQNNALNISYSVKRLIKIEYLSGPGRVAPQKKIFFFFLKELRVWI